MGVCDVAVVAGKGTSNFSANMSVCKGVTDECLSESSSTTAVKPSISSMDVCKDAVDTGDDVDCDQLEAAYHKKQSDGVVNVQLLKDGIASIGPRCGEHIGPLYHGDFQLRKNRPSKKIRKAAKKSQSGGSSVGQTSASAAEDQDRMCNDVTSNAEHLHDDVAERIRFLSKKLTSGGIRAATNAVISRTDFMGSSHEHFLQQLVRALEEKVEEEVADSEWPCLGA